MHYRDLMKMDGLIFLHKIIEDVEKEEGSLTIQITRGKVSSKTVPAIEVDDVVIEANPIEIDEGLPILEVIFGSYVSYSVLNESYTPYLEDEVYVGGMVRTYTNSTYLDFITRRTFAHEVYPNLVHYQVPCLNHVIDVISSEEPRVREISRDHY